MRNAFFIVALFLMAAVVPLPVSAVSTDPTGARPVQPHNNMQPFVTLRPVISPFQPFELGDVRVRFDAGFHDLSIPAQGQLLPIDSSQTLFSQLGTTYGGDGETTLGLPDLRGRTVNHVGANNNVGNRFGTETVTLTEAQIPAHSHTWLPSNVAGTDALRTAIVGGNQFHNNQQPGLNMRYMIALDGVIPSENGSNPEDSFFDPFIGEVAITASPIGIAPEGWAFTEGQILPIQAHTALFSILGTTYGGDGEITFALPNLIGRTPIGVGDSPRDDIPFDIQLGERIGANDHTLRTSEMPQHAHGLSETAVIDPTSMTGNNQSHNNLQATLGLNYIIALDGIYPSEDGPVPNATFLGEVKLFAGNFAPEGYALAHGQLLNIANNTALFSLLGTTYGGDGETTFALPDLRGKVVIGDGRGPGLTSRRVGDTGGNSQVTLTTLQIPSHTHDLFQNILTGAVIQLGSVETPGALGVDLGDDSAGVFTAHYYVEGDVDAVPGSGFQLASDPAQYWDLQFDGLLEGIAELAFTYDDAGMTAAEENALAIFHIDDVGTAIELERVSLDTVANLLTVLLPSEQGFSPFVLGIQGVQGPSGPGGAGVPEPMSAGLLGLGLLTLAGRRRRRHVA